MFYILFVIFILCTSVNANVDLVISARKVFEELGIKPGSDSKNHNEISSLKDLEECFSHFFKRCAAAERVVSSKEVFKEIVEASMRISDSQVWTVFCFNPCPNKLPMMLILYFLEKILQLDLPLITLIHKSTGFSYMTPKAKISDNFILLKWN